LDNLRLGSTHLLGDALLDQFEDEENETVMAHEFAHRVQDDIPVGILVGGMLTLGGLYLASRDRLGHILIVLFDLR
jgi:Zn-dependent protease with chaperone function